MRRRGRVIENTQRCTKSESADTTGKVCVCVSARASTERASEKVLMNKGLNCERDKLTLTSDEILSLFLLLKTSIR